MAFGVNPWACLTPEVHVRASYFLFIWTLLAFRECCTSCILPHKHPAETKMNKTIHLISLSTLLGKARCKRWSSIIHEICLLRSRWCFFCLTFLRCMYAYLDGITPTTRYTLSAKNGGLNFRHQSLLQYSLDMPPLQRGRLSSQIFSPCITGIFYARVSWASIFSRNSWW